MIEPQLITDVLQLMKPETSGIVILILATAFLFQGCSMFGASDDILRNQTGNLSWSGSPAADGSGITFKTEDERYGVPGTREDYADYFAGEENQVQVVADIRLTGKTTVRGWGVEYPEITFINIKRVE